MLAQRTANWSGAISFYALGWVFLGIAATAAAVAGMCLLHGAAATWRRSTHFRATPGTHPDVTTSVADGVGAGCGWSAAPQFEKSA